MAVKRGITKAKLKKDSLAIIEKNKCMFNEDVISLLPIVKQTYYKYGLNKDPDIIESLDNNKVLAKMNMRAKWYRSENSTLQIAFMKLIGNKEERLVLSNMYNIKVDVDDINVQFTKLAEIMDAVNRTDCNKSNNGDPA